jgi:WD40 repeat protein
MKMTRTSAIGVHFIAAVVCILWCDLAYTQELKPRAILEGHKDRVISLAFSPDSKTLASGGDDGITRLWDVATCKSTAMLEDTPSNSLHFSPDGRNLAIVYGTESTIWDVSTRKRRELKDESWSSQCIRFMGCFSPDGKILATGGLCFPDIGLWDVKTGKLLRLLEEKTVAGHRLFQDVRIAPDGKTLLAYGSIAGLRKWDVTSGKSLPVVDLPKPFRADDIGDLLVGAISPDCKLLAVSVQGEYEEKDGKEVAKTPPYVAILDVATGKTTATLRGFTHSIMPLKFSADGKTLAGGSYDVALLWDVATGREIASFKTKDEGIQSIALSPDGKMLATADFEEKTIRLWAVPAKR